MCSDNVYAVVLILTCVCVHASLRALGEPLAEALATDGATLGKEKVLPPAG